MTALMQDKGGRIVGPGAVEIRLMTVCRARSSIETLISSATGFRSRYDVTVKVFSDELRDGEKGRRALY